jgi:hypothetical protein
MQNELKRIRTFIIGQQYLFAHASWRKMESLFESLTTAVSGAAPIAVAAAFAWGILSILITKPALDASLNNFELNREDPIICKKAN